MAEVRHVDSSVAVLLESIGDDTNKVVQGSESILVMRGRLFFF